MNGTEATGGILFNQHNGITKVCIVLPTDERTVTAVCVILVSILSYLYFRHWASKEHWKKVLAKIFCLIKSIPIVQQKLKQEINKVKTDLRKSIHHSDDTNISFTKLPESGIPKDQLTSLTRCYSTLEAPDYYGGRVSGAVFNDEMNKDELEIYKEVTANFAWSNPLWPKLFPGVRKMEAEVVRMTCTLLGGDEETCGTMSSGGSMSILLACLAHRNRAYSRGIKNPEIILPSTAHAAFFKSAEVFRLHVVEIFVSGPTFTVDVNKVQQAITSNTAMIVASAPNFPYGTIDDIEALGRLALAHDIPLHVDACLGGFILPFLDNTEFGHPRIDFRVPGVTSISADTHKYGLAPKGSSVIVYRNKDYLHHQYYCNPDWQGGVYASATLEGSRAGINIAMTWAALLYHGFDTYRFNAKAIVDTTRKIRDGIRKCHHLQVQGSPDVCVVSFTSSTINIHRFQDLMYERGWQLSNLQFPSGVHLMVTQNHIKPGIAELFINDVIEVAEIIAASPKVKSTGPAALYGMIQKLPDRTIVSDFAHVYLDVCYEPAKTE
uniref:sphinganine-1-phosphate aldolase n=1 Tax=Panagrellus redivivus TaxID=6233 RepID=A0A7E4V6Y2_PANRE